MYRRDLVFPAAAASGEIYVTNGDSDDWLYGDIQTKSWVLGFTIELNSYGEGGYAPPESLIQPTFEKMLAMNLTALRVAADPRLYAITDTTPVPSASYLEQNYPNPFNPSTCIPFSLEEDGFVSLAIYDVRGRLVHVLISKDMKSGDYSTAWDGRDAQGRKVGSGVYFTRLKAGEKTLARKMVLLR